MNDLRTNIIPLSRPTDMPLAIRELEFRINEVNRAILAGELGGSSGGLEIFGGTASITPPPSAVIDGGSA